MNIVIPDSRQLSDIEKFIYGLRELLIKCNATTIEHSGIGVHHITFADGTNGGLRAIFGETKLINI